MIDKPVRKKLAEKLRQFVSGRFTNYQYEDMTPRRSPDRAIWAIQQRVWTVYDDLHEHKLTGKWALTKEGKAIVSRCILFLHSNYEYEWPKHPAENVLGAMLSLFSLGLIPKFFWNKKWIKSGNSKVWPFINQKSLDKAKRTPKLLNG